MIRSLTGDYDLNEQADYHRHASGGQPLSRHVAYGRDDVRGSHAGVKLRKTVSLL